MTHWPKQVEYDDLAIDLTLIDITGIEDPLRDGVREAVANCKMASIRAMCCPVDRSTMWHLHYLRCYHGRTTFLLTVMGRHEGVRGGTCGALGNKQSAVTLAPFLSKAHPLILECRASCVTLDHVMWWRQQSVLSRRDPSPSSCVLHFTCRPRVFHLISLFPLHPH